MLVSLQVRLPESSFARVFKIVSQRLMKPIDAGHFSWPTAPHSGQTWGIVMILSPSTEPSYNGREGLTTPRPSGTMLQILSFRE